jgi:hypothetical protein
MVIFYVAHFDFLQLDIAQRSWIGFFLARGASGGSNGDA